MLLLLLPSHTTPAGADENPIEETEMAAPQAGAQDKIAIRRFVIIGNTRFSVEDLNQQLQRFVGRNRTKADIEAAREALELFYCEQGYSGAMVKIVEPSPGTAVIALEVQENQPLQITAVEESSGVDALAAPVMEQLEPEKQAAAVEVEKAAQTAPPAAAEKPEKSDDAEFLLEEPKAETAQNDGTFTIKGFIIEGTFLFTQEELQRQVKNFVGRGKSAADVEGARDALERFFHEQGYPAMLVNIPAQSSSDRIFRLDVIENRIGNVLISGNRWFSTEKILRDIPSILPGKALNLKDLQNETNFANRNPDFKVIPEMQQGKAPETIDIALKVQENLPLHGSLELNNRASHDTTALRLNAALRYDNLWQRDHSISVQYQMSPQKLDEVEVVSASYTQPMFWNHEDKLVVYGVVSNSNTNSAVGYSNLGKGNVIGTRLIIPLQGSDGFFHSAVTGFDFKDFSETVGLAGAPGVKTPIQYFPVTAGYSAFLRDNSGMTSFTSGITVIFRGAVSDPREFEDKRYKSRGNSIAMTAGVERNQKLPEGFSLLAKVDGQLSDQPLISNEQYVAGGVESVRGYRESEASGDNSLHGVIELAAPELLKQACKERFSVIPYLFYDIAHLWVRDPLPGQNWFANLQGIGFGLRGALLKNVDFQTDLGFPLRETSLTKAGDAHLHFKLRYQF
jgi:hemolysin activation/secretion protein